jgi:hypothetical protein
MRYEVRGLKEAEIFKLVLKVFDLGSWLLVLGSWFLALLSVVCYLKKAVNLK